MQKTYSSFREFYPFYLGEHQNSTNRVLHLIGTSLVMSWLIFCSALGEPLWALLSPIFGYAFAWVGHFLIEKNRPATFTHPFYSLMGDFRMAFDICRSRKLHFERSPAV